MAQPFIGEIRMFAGNFEPQGWAFCHGQLLAISENDALFSLIGTTYGGDGMNTFALPDLRGRLPMHQGSGAGLSSRTIGEQTGTESVTLTSTQTPAHQHTMQGSTAAATTRQPAGNVPATAFGGVYFPNTDPTAMAPSAAAGGAQPHDNMMPTLGMNFIISLFGIFPSQT